MMKKSTILINVFIIISILVLVAIREVKSDYIKLSVAEVHELSMDSVIYITPEDIENEATIINLDFDTSSETKLLYSSSLTVINIHAAEILERQNRKILNKLKGDIVLQSNDMQILSATWVALTQLGYKRVKLLVKEDTELLKYEFQPGQVAGLK